MLLKVLLPGGRAKLCKGEWIREESPVGWRVLVSTPEGGRTGVVVGVQEEGEVQAEIISFPDKMPLLTTAQLSLLDDLASSYLMPKGVLLFKLLPSTFLWEEEEVIVTGRKGWEGLDRRSKEVLEYVKKRRGVKPENLKKRFGSELVRLLLNKGFLTREKKWKVPKVEVRFYRLNLPLQEAMKRVRSKEKKRILVFLSGRLSVSEEELLEWGFKRSDVNDLGRKGILSIEKEYVGSIREIPLRQRTVSLKRWGDRAVLWSHFKRAVDEISYIADQNLSRGRSTLLLFPDSEELLEVSQRLKSEFGDRVIEIYSKVNSREIVEGWFSAQERESIVVGSYIASLCPAKDTESVILFNESSPGVKLKHMGNLDLRRLSLLLARRVGANLLFTTPAPSLGTFLMVKEGKMDMDREEQTAKTVILKRDPEEVLTEEAFRILESSREKDILFLVPKHGYSYVYCPRCETPVECPECGTFLTYSKAKGEIHCTTCSYRLEEFSCPECGGHVEELGFGIEKVIETVERNFGIKENFHFSTYPTWSRTYDITLIASADGFLSIPSYRATEDLFLYLVRSLYSTKDKLIVQTVFPEEEIFKKVSRKDFEAFYEEELAYREREMLPPFWRMALIKVKNKEIRSYIFKTVSPNVKMSYNLREKCYDILVKFKDRRALFKLAGLKKKFGKYIIELRVDPF